MKTDNRVNQESDEERDSSEKRRTRKHSWRWRLNEHEQNDYENGIEDDVVCSKDVQNVRKSENHGEQQEEQVAEEVKQESLPEEILEIIVNLSMTEHN